LTVLSVPAHAQGTDIMALLDLDGDGTLSRDEIIVLRQQIFAKIDADGNGALTQAEIDAAREAAAKRRGFPGRNLSASLDTDGNGELSLAEFTAKTPGFDRADKDGDGRLTGAEIDQALQVLRAFIANR
jgi:Ca2+-binding EF-hand superfamily protein